MSDLTELLELTKNKLKSKLKADLQTVCQEHGLDESGTKNDLLERVWEFLESKRGADETKEGGEAEMAVEEEDEEAADVVEETPEDDVEEADVVEEEEDDVIVEETENTETEKMEEDAAEDATEEPVKAKLIDLPDTTENKAFLEEQPPATTEDDNTQTETEESKAAPKSAEDRRNSTNPNRLYFGNLAFDKVDNDVRTIFEGCGEITDIHIIRDRYSRRSQGYGFITFADEESKQKALKLDGKDFFGRPLKVNLEARNRDPSVRSKAKTRLFIKNIPTDKTEDDVKALFTKFGSIENFFFIKDHNTDVSRGFGFMDFANAAEAQAALSMNGEQAFGGPLVVKIAEEKNSRGGNRGRGRRDFGGGRGHGRRGGYQQSFDPYNNFNNWGGYGGYGGYSGYGGYGGYAGYGYGGYGAGAWYGAQGAYPGK